MTVHVKQPAEAKQQDVVAELDRARRRIDVDRQLAEWCIDLTARLKCAQGAVMDYHEGTATVRDLQTEFERFKLAVWLAKKARRP